MKNFYPLIGMLMFLGLVIHSPHAEAARKCRLSVSNASELGIKVTIPLLLNNKYLEAGASTSQAYSSNNVSQEDSYRLPVTVLNDRNTLLQGLWLMGGALIGQELMSPAFFRDPGQRSKELNFTKNGKAVNVRLEVSCE